MWTGYMLELALAQVTMAGNFGSFETFFNMGDSLIGGLDIEL